VESGQVLDVYVTILRAALRGVYRTSLAQDLRLRGTNIERHIRDLIERGLLIEKRTHLMGGMTIYRTTKKGEEFLGHYDMMTELIEVVA